MVNGKIKKEHADRIAAAKKKWDDSSPEWKDKWYENICISVREFVAWWDTLKAIESKFNVEVWGIAFDRRYKGHYELGQAWAKNYSDQGLGELYDAYTSIYEGVCQMEYEEFTDEVCSLRVRYCPCVGCFREMGRGEDEIKEMAPLFCLGDEGVMTGFNPQLENYRQPRLIMKGDPYCSYRTEDHRGRKRK